MIVGIEELVFVWSRLIFLGKSDVVSITGTF